MDFPIQKKFYSRRVNRNRNKLEHFMGEWNAHGDSLTAAYAIPYNRFIVIANDETKVPVSGCSIDTLSHLIKEIEDKFQLGLLNRMLVSYAIGEEIITLPLK